MEIRSSPPEYLTTREVAELLRVKERKVYEMAAAEEIPCRRVTGKLLFPRVELEAWLVGELPVGGGRAVAVARPAPASVVAGSHDPLLDWAIRESGSGLATFFDGSLDGLTRLETGDAMAAGLHVFEPDRDDWNIRHVTNSLGSAPVVLVEWAIRRQGLILSAGLAESVRSIGDLRGKCLVRRQPAAGAGILLNHLLQEAGITSNEITFSKDVARTETDAAVAVASGRADAAPGLEAMAKQFGLAFVPTQEERFDLVVDRRSWFEPPFQALLEFCRGDAFAAKAEELGGYNLSGHGRVHWNGA
ncbi:helix-turn-helix transcriptional regulator [Pelagibius sp. Alg239-R121]|uniref:helix-turn-helix transcriptional regulator n=1 Tax=Pelagibius sp. Alg239-R121 TaxID=2993448 RepID=UPI0024A7A3BC|nr:helix-turn-helix transcriptional regulator [Pelagibius sp. Alg239-R121]